MKTCDCTKEDGFQGHIIIKPCAEHARFVSELLSGVDAEDSE